MSDLISRQAMIDELKDRYRDADKWGKDSIDIAIKARAESCKATLVEMKLCVEKLPSAELERVWHPVEKPPAHHKDVIVRGVEAIGNVTVHKVMQWDVDTWRPTNYAPSITWTEWSEI